MRTLEDAAAELAARTSALDTLATREPYAVWREVAGTIDWALELLRDEDLMADVRAEEAWAEEGVWEEGACDEEDLSEAPAPALTSSTLTSSAVYDLIDTSVERLLEEQRPKQALDFARRNRDARFVGVVEIANIFVASGFEDLAIDYLTPIADDALDSRIHHRLVSLLADADSRDDAIEVYWSRFETRPSLVFLNDALDLLDAGPSRETLVERAVEFLDGKRAHRQLVTLLLQENRVHDALATLSELSGDDAIEVRPHVAEALLGDEPTLAIQATFDQANALAKRANDGDFARVVATLQALRTRIEDREELLADFEARLATFRRRTAHLLPLKRRLRTL